MLVHKFIIIIKKYFDLKKYTAPTRYKKYYEQNKEKIIEQKKEYNKSKKNEKN